MCLHHIKGGFKPFCCPDTYMEVHVFLSKLIVTMRHVSERKPAQFVEN